LHSVHARVIVGLLSPLAIWWSSDPFRVLLRCWLRPDAFPLRLRETHS
jgi:hypothetical protein